MKKQRGGGGGGGGGGSVIGSSNICRSNPEQHNHDQQRKGAATGPTHPIWNKIRYAACNTFPESFSKRHKDSFLRSELDSIVEVRNLAPPHPLAGEQGLFARTRFEPFDLIGRYCF